MADAYIGLAVILAQDIRNTDSTVQDSRDEYCGHAHIAHGIILPVHEPPTSEIGLYITERCRKLVEVTTLYRDPNPAAAKWTGPEF